MLKNRIATMSPLFALFLVGCLHVPEFDPVAKIERGDIVVEVTTVAQVPQTYDKPGVEANTAYARIQNLMPAPFAGSRDFFVNDTRGHLYRVSRGTDGSPAGVTEFLNLKKELKEFDDSFYPNEAGFAGFAFHPDFDQPGKPGYGKFYTAYSATRGTGKCDYLGDDNASHESVVREWTVKSIHAPTFEGTHREVFRVGQFGRNHNIGSLGFNPHARPGDSDYGQLYISFGDGASSHDPHQYGQSLKEPLGAICRINPLQGPNGEKYTVPADNPFVGQKDAAGEIWAYGLRHPQFFHWDLGGNHRFYIADMGQDAIDEINLGVKGGNYGWQLREGTYATGTNTGAMNGPVYTKPPTDPTELIYPVAQYDHDDGKAIGAAVVYRGKKVPALVGKLVCSDIVTGRIFYVDEAKLELGDQKPLKELILSFDGVERPLRQVTSHSGGRVDLRLGIDAEGEMYLLTKSDGKIRTVGPRQEKPLNARTTPR